MALRSGYKGFKKVINGLKVFRPGVLGLDLGTGLVVDANGKLKVTGDLEDYAPNIIANTKLIKDTVGWTGKNLCNGVATSETSQGVTWTVDANDNNIVTVSGTPTGFKSFSIRSTNVLPVGDYIFSGISDTENISWNRLVLLKNDAEVRTSAEYTTNQPITFSILDSDDYDTVKIELKRISNDVACSGTAKIMIRKADILDATYEPYRGTTAFPRDEQAVFGAKNLYDCIANTTTDEYGLTWTVDATDKNIITVSGTPSGFKAFPTYSNNVLPAGRYILSGILEDTTNISVNYLGLRNGTFIVQELTKTLVGTEFYFDIPENVSYDNIYITLKRNDNNVACSGTIKLMIRLATDTDPTYAPFAMTNRELTEKVQGIINAATNAADFAAFKAAMEAITPVTRSAPASDTRSIPEEDPEEKEAEEASEPVTKKRLTKKTVKEGE